MTDPLKNLAAQLAPVSAAQPFGKVMGISGLVVNAEGLPNTAVGGRCLIETRNGARIHAEIVGFKDGDALLMAFGALEGVGPGCAVYPVAEQAGIVVNNGMIGRIVNALGEPIDGKGPLPLSGELHALKAPAPLASERRPIGRKLDVGVRTLNMFVPLCRGQRIGIFSGSGVGKSTLLGMIAKYADSEVNVIALVGERGREVMEFIHNSLGAEGLARSVVVVATGDEPPLMRRQAAYTAMAIAEYFRGCGFQVMMMMDSVTRFAMAQREIGLSAGEPPTTRGYTPSVFAELPRLLERAGTCAGEGAITGLFTVLVEGSDMDEPVADAVRGILDGHIVLERELAEQGHFPAINVLRSVSRAAPACNSAAENNLISRARKLYSTYSNMAELIRLGAYKKGSDVAVDEAIHYYEPLTAFLQQQPDEIARLDECYTQLATALDVDVENEADAEAEAPSIAAAESITDEA